MYTIAMCNDKCLIEDVTLTENENENMKKKMIIKNLCV